MSLLTRGRLINKFIAVIARLDTEATANVAGGGYDDVFDAVKPVSDGTQLGASSRREMAEIRLHCQLDRRSWGERTVDRGGGQTRSDIVVTLFWEEMENQGLIDANSEPLLKQGDRFVRIETLKGQIEATFKPDPGMLFDELERAGHGLDPFGTPRTNLLYVFASYPRLEEDI